jgi:hypothetical protein
MAIANRRAKLETRHAGHLDVGDDHACGHPGKLLQARDRRLDRVDFETASLQSQAQ